MGRQFAIAHATLELECVTCAEGGGAPCGMDGELSARLVHHH